MPLLLKFLHRALNVADLVHPLLHGLFHPLHPAIQLFTKFSETLPQGVTDFESPLLRENPPRGLGIIILSIFRANPAHSHVTVEHNG